MKRDRLVYLLICGALIGIALATRRLGQVFPKVVVIYGGDTLWATMIFFALGFVFVRWSTLQLFVVALLVCYAAETSQLYHAPWIDAVRNTRLGGIILGYGFLWGDILCYTIGTLAGMLLEMVFNRSCRKISARHES